MLRLFTIGTDGDEALPGTEGIGGDDRLLKLGFRVELIGPDPEDGGPRCIAACPDVATAQAITNALELAAKL